MPDRGGVHACQRVRRGQDERADALAQAEHDYLAIVAAGAEAAPLVAQLASADREATDREVGLARVVLEQMGELAEAVEGRLPRPR